GQRRRSPRRLHVPLHRRSARVRDAGDPLPAAPGARRRARARRGAGLSRASDAPSSGWAPRAVPVAPAAQVAPVIRQAQAPGLRMLALRVACANLVAAFEASSDPRARALLPPPGGTSVASC